MKTTQSIHCILQNIPSGPAAICSELHHYFWQAVRIVTSRGVNQHYKSPYVSSDQILLPNFGNSNCFVRVFGLQIVDRGRGCGCPLPHFIDSKKSKLNFEKLEGDREFAGQTSGSATATPVCLPRGPSSSSPPTPTHLGPGPHRLLEAHFA